MSNKKNINSNSSSNDVDTIIQSIEGTSGLFTETVHLDKTNEKSVDEGGKMKNKKNRLDKTLDTLNDKSYKKSSVIYVDDDVHAAFLRIKELYKMSHKISIGDLMSFLGEKFLLENKADILEMINNNQNKFLSQ